MAWRVCLRTTWELHSPDMPPVPMPVELLYDSREPAAVRVAFAPPHGRVWTVERDALRDGRRCPVAVGAVLVRPSTSSSTETVLEFDTADGVVMFSVARPVLTEFLREVYRVVPAGRELAGRAVDVVELPALTGGG